MPDARDGAPRPLSEPPGPPNPGETPDQRLARLRLRSRRRGIREMDLLLGVFADEELARLPPEALADYESLLSENDQDLYLWVSHRQGSPERHEGILRRIAVFHGIE